MGTEFGSLITNEFLEYIFKRQVASFTVFPGTKPGDNYLSYVHCVKVYFKDDKVENLFIKCYPETESTCEFLDKVQVFHTEYFIYSEFLPALNKLAEEINGSLKKEDVFINVAKFYGGNIVGSKYTTLDKTPWDTHNCIILEDLRPQGYKMMERVKGLSLEHCKLIINQLASLHALSWVYKKRNGLKRLADKHPLIQDSMYKEDTEAGWKPVMDGIQRVCLSVIEKEFGSDSEITRNFESFMFKNMMALARQFLNPDGFDEGEIEKLLRIKPEKSSPVDDEPWTVATHGDCSINNSLFLSKSDSNPSKVALIDHQTFREACLTTDLSYFIYCSVNPPDRKPFMDILLPIYFEKFTKIVTSLKEKLPDGFTYSNLLSKWNRARLFAMALYPQFIAFVFKPSLMAKVKTALAENPNWTTASLTISKDISNKIAESLDNEDPTDTLWKQVLIQTVLQEYNDGIL